MSSERWAILLEFVSFFLVTLDLFGKSRLKAFQLRLSTWATKIKEIKIVESYNAGIARIFKRLKLYDSTGKLKGFVIPGLYFFLFLIAGAAIFSAVVKSQYVEHFAAFLLILSYVTLAVLILLAALFIVEWLLDKLIDLVLFMFDKLHLEGIFLVAGAILFTISKAISFLL